MEWGIWINWWIIFCIKTKKKKHEAVADNPLINIYVNKTENKIMIKIETGYFFELLTPETIKLLGSTKIKITKDKNG